MDTSTFAQKIKAKYPAYQNVDDATLVKKFIEKYPEYKSQVQQEPTITQNISTDLQQRGQNISNINKARTEGQSVTGEILNAVAPNSLTKVKSAVGTAQKIRERLGMGNQVATGGQVAGGINDVLGEAIGAIIPEKWKQFGADKVQNLLGQAGIDTIEKYNEWATQNPLTAKNIEGAVNIASLLPTGKAAEVTGKVGMETVQTGAEQLAKGTGELVQAGSKLKDEAIQILAPQIDDKVKNVLINTPTEKFDNIVKIAQESASSNTAPSTFETVSKSMTDATKQMQSQAKSLAEQKASIIGKAKTGLSDFTKETGQTILDINRKLKGSGLGNEFIAKLKTVKTKIDADKVIDELQNTLYKGNKDMTIPIGSSEDKLLKGILGEYNGKLKASLPSSYAKINTEISNRMKAVNILNRALGETVDGVSTRGAGLVKQFFSPSGTKTKQLFEYIKKTTGVNLAEDATLAKYVADAYGDVKTRSLLEGVPTSTGGIVDKALEFTLDKTGVSGAFNKAKTEGMIKKARSLTKTTK